MELHVTTQGLKDDGLSDRQIRTMVGRRELTRIRRGAFVREDEPDVRRRHLLLLRATAPVLGDRTVVSHASAALLLGLPVPEPLLRQVTVTRQRTTRGGGNSRPQVRTFTGSLAEDEVSVVDGFRVTSVSRTAADLARLLPRRDAVVLLDAALHDQRGGELANRRVEIADHLVRARSKRGFSLACRYLNESDGRAESPLESLSRLCFRDHGLPEAVLQYVVRDARGEFIARCDFGWPEFHVVGEADGLVKYRGMLRPGESATDAVIREKVREDRIRAQGLLVRRWTQADLGPALCQSIEDLFRIARLRA